MSQEEISRFERRAAEQRALAAKTRDTAEARACLSLADQYEAVATIYKRLLSRASSGLASAR